MLGAWKPQIFSVANSSLDLSDRAVLGPLARLLSAVREVARETPLLLVGAAARDLLLVHAHGIDPQRADRSIEWPPEGAQVMNVSGLTEALATAVAVRLPGGVSHHVASLAALALLRIWAWKDRKYTTPGRDAFDLWLILRHYADAGNHDRLFGQEGEAALTSFGFDLEKAGAWLLGSDAREVLARGPGPRESLESLDAILKPEIDPDGPLRLVGQMPPGDRDRQLSLLTALCTGLFDKQVAGGVNQL